MSPVAAPASERFAPPVMPTHGKLPPLTPHLRGSGPTGTILERRLSITYWGGWERFRQHLNSREKARLWPAQGWRTENVNGRMVLIQTLNNDGSLTEAGRKRLAEFDAKTAALAVEEKWEPQALPEDWETLVAGGGRFAYQIPSARRLAHALRSIRGAWDCSDLGTGKTFASLLAALSVAQEEKRLVGVICPKAVIPPWIKAFRVFKERPAFVLNYDSARRGKLPKIRHYGFEEWERKQPPCLVRGHHVEFLAPEKTLLIFDEAHNCKNQGTLNQAMLLAACRQKIPHICVSGTIAADPTQMFGTGQSVGLHTGESRTAGAPIWAEFLAASGVVKGWDGQPYFKDKTKLVTIHRRIFGKLAKNCRGTRVKIADLGDAFPETQILCEAFETDETAAIAKAYRDAKQELADIAAAYGEAAAAKAEQGVYVKVKKAVELCKVNAVVAMAREEISEGRSVAIFCNFTEPREKIMEALGARACIHGQQTTDERARWIDEFQADRERVIVANIDAGGVGVSLHDIHGNHPRSSIILPSDKATSMKQALGRVHRAGGRSKSRQIVFFAADTVEEGICERVREKLQNIDRLNDGDLNPEEAF